MFTVWLQDQIQNAKRLKQQAEHIDWPDAVTEADRRIDSCQHVLTLLENNQ